MINKILMGIMKLIISLVSLLLRPIDALIEQFLPGLNDVFTAIGALLDVIADGLAWVISAFGLHPTALSFLVMYWTFALTLPIVVYTIKLAIKWYDKIKP